MFRGAPSNFALLAAATLLVSLPLAAVATTAGAAPMGTTQPQDAARPRAFVLEPALAFAGAGRGTIEHAAELHAFVGASGAMRARAQRLKCVVCIRTAIPPRRDARTLRRFACRQRHDSRAAHAAGAWRLEATAPFVRQSNVLNDLVQHQGEPARFASALAEMSAARAVYRLRVEGGAEAQVSPREVCFVIIPHSVSSTAAVAKARGDARMLMRHALLAGPERDCGCRAAVPQLARARLRRRSRPSHRRRHAHHRRVLVHPAPRRRLNAGRAAA